MPTTLTALLAAVLYDARSVDADPTAIERAAELLAIATGGRAVTLEREGDRLVVGGLPIPTEAPGAAIVSEALARHQVSRLALPPGMATADWRAWGELFASARGLYPSVDHLAAALAAILPDARLTAARSDAAPSPPPLGRDHGPQDLPWPALAPAPDLTTSAADRGTLSRDLDPLLTACRDAVDRKDWHELATALLGLNRLEQALGEGGKATVAHARRRVTSTAALANLVRLVAQEGRHSVAAQALILLGRDGADAIIDALAEPLSRSDRRVLLDLLARLDDVDEVIIGQLQSHLPDLARDMAEVAGRRRIEAAVAPLAMLLRHREEAVRTASWRALEEIGTPAALAVLAGSR